jgi:uncharacterized repeat protein (TIGR03943 family)
MLICVGSGLLWILVTDMYVRYVRPVMGPGLAASGVVLIALGLWTLSGRGLPSPGHRDQHGVGHDHHEGPRIGWLLAIPVVVVFMVQPPALGAYSAARSTSGTSGTALKGRRAPLPTGDPVDLTIYDYLLRAVWSHGEGLGGRTIRLTGFVTPGETGTWSLTRVHIACCAADATAFSVTVVGDLAAPPADSWVQLTGQYVPLTAPPTYMSRPILHATKATPISPPSDPYE